MPRITNRHGLPEALVRAVQNDPYTRGGSDYSTTQLGKPSRIVALEDQHRDEIEEDVSDRIYALLGQLGHSILERAGTANIVEKRLYAEINGYTISGQLDIVDGTEIQDWKFTSRYAADGTVKPEYTQQASVNRWLCHKNGIEISKATYILILRDWSKPMAARRSDYPQSQVVAIDVPMWSLERTEQWIASRVESHEKAKKESLPLCTKEERWCNGSKVAVMQKGKKRALKLCESMEEAKSYVAFNSLENIRFEDRPGENTRCLHYCGVSAFCAQFRELIQEQ